MDEVSSEYKITSRRKPVVLVVDDDAIIRRLYSDLLRDEFCLVRYGDGAKARDYINSGANCDVAVFDNNLGISPTTGKKISGEDLSQLLREKKPKTPIIRACGNFNDFYSDIAPTGDFFLAKPFKSNAEVLSMVRCASVLSSL